MSTWLFFFVYGNSTVKQMSFFSLYSHLLKKEVFLLYLIENKAINTESVRKDLTWLKYTLT